MNQQSAVSGQRSANAGAGSCIVITSAIDDPAAAPIAMEQYSSIRQAMDSPMGAWRRGLVLTLIVIDPRHPEYLQPRVIARDGERVTENEYTVDLVLTPEAEAVLEQAQRATESFARLGADSDGSMSIDGPVSTLEGDELGDAHGDVVINVPARRPPSYQTAEADDAVV